MSSSNILLDYCLAGSKDQVLIKFSTENEAKNTRTALYKIRKAYSLTRPGEMDFSAKIIPHNGAFYLSLQPVGWLTIGKKLEDNEIPDELRIKAPVSPLSTPSLNQLMQPTQVPQQHSPAWEAERQKALEQNVVFGTPIPEHLKLPTD